MMDGPPRPSHVVNICVADGNNMDDGVDNEDIHHYRCNRDVDNHHLPSATKV